MFRQGDIVFAPCPSTDGEQILNPHYLVVLQESSAGVLCMFTTSLKERTGGDFAFTDAERSAAGFTKPCRFDPSRLVLYKPAHKHVLQVKPYRLHAKMMQRLLQAAQSMRASYVTYKHVANE